MKALCAIGPRLVACCVFAAACMLDAQAAGVQQAFLVQNSGWMEPFYTDETSQLKPLVAAVVDAATAADDTVHLLAFSQTQGNNASPVLLYSGRGASNTATQLAGLTVARKGAGPALADTDFKEAITRTITGPFKASPGILWIFTNNKNSPNNDPQTAERNRDFYRLLHLEPSITKTLVFPLRMPVKGKLYTAKGLMVYALAYGQPAAEALDQILAEGRLGKVLTHAPARLKPVDQDAARLVPQQVLDSHNVRASLAQDRRTLILDVDAADLLLNVTLKASLENLFFPYVIRSARVDAALLTGSGRTAMRVSPSIIENLPPGGSQSVEVSFTLPLAMVPSPWSSEALVAMGRQVQIPLIIEMTLTDQQLAASASFADQLRELFPGDPISDVFAPPESVRGSHTRVPLLLRVQYPLAPVIGLMGALLLLFVASLALWVASRSSKRYEVMVDGVKRIVILKPFQALHIRDGDGQPVGTLRRGWGMPHIVHVHEGRSLHLAGR